LEFEKPTPGKRRRLSGGQVEATGVEDLSQAFGGPASARFTEVAGAGRRKKSSASTPVSKGSRHLLK